MNYCEFVVIYLFYLSTTEGKTAVGTLQPSSDAVTKSSILNAGLDAEIITAAEDGNVAQITDVPEYSHDFQNDKFLFQSERYQSSSKGNLCSKRSKCEPLIESTCLGAKLPYSHTSMELSKLHNQHMARDILKKLSQTLVNIPRCWSVIQPFLCSVLFPSCSNGTVQLPSKEMCLIIKGPCKIIEEKGNWPEFLGCKEEYASNCQTASQGLAYNTTGQCSLPLVKTNKEHRWYPGIRGCGVQCSYPVLSEEESEDIKSFIKLFGGFSLAFSLFNVLTFLIDLKVAFRYPGKIVFFVNACFLIANSAFMFQFQTSNISCNSDGTVRKSEPSSGNNMMCMTIFVLVYYCQIAAGVWHVILAYSLQKSFQSRDVRQCRLELDQLGGYFHLVAWSLPLIFTITILALAEVEGDPVAGICYLSNAPYVRIIFLLIPFVAFVVLACSLLTKGILILMSLKKQCTKISNGKKTMVQTIVRLFSMSFFMCILMGISIFFHAYFYSNSENWSLSLEEYILCTSKITQPQEYGADCTMKKRPNINLFKTHLFAFFGAGIACSSWCWTTNSIEAWQRFFLRLCGITREDQRRINQTYPQRKPSEQISTAMQSLPPHHMDNILNFHMNSVMSSDLSLWGTAMRNFNDQTIFGINKRVSIDSRAGRGRLVRRHSLDSQMSFHVSDVERTVALQTVSHFRGRRKQKTWLSRRGNKYIYGDRKPSNTSDDSNLGSFSGIVPSFMPSTQDSLFTKTMKIVNNGNQKSILKEQLKLPVDSDGDSVHTDQDKHPQFSRKFGAHRRGRRRSSKTENCPPVFKASIGVQTSLDSLPVLKTTEDRSCQFPSPTLNSRDIINISDSFQSNSLIYKNTQVPLGFESNELKRSGDASSIA